MKTAFIVVLLCVLFSVAFATTGIFVLDDTYKASNCNEIKNQCYQPQVKEEHYERCWELLQLCYAEK